MDIITLSQFQNEFNLVFDKSLSKQYIINNELDEILSHINTTQNHKAFHKLKTQPFTNNLKGTFKKLLNKSNDSFFSTAFNNYMLEGKSEIERTDSDTEATYQFKLKTTNQAYEFAEYYKWLEQLKLQPQKREKKSEVLNHKERMLALYYLGLDMRKFGNNLQAAKILSKIIGFDESNTKKFLTYFDGK